MTENRVRDLRNANLFPDDIDFHSRTLTLRPVTASHLREASFLDGRSDFASGPMRRHSSLSWSKDWTVSNDQPVAMIFHTAFCGSTLLSKLIDIPNKTIGLREPRILITLADAKIAKVKDYLSLLHTISRSLGRPIDGCRPIIKPSNWCNALLPEWSDPRLINPIFMTMEPRAHLAAVFRGGRDRIAFSLRVTQHLANLFSDGATLIHAAVKAGGESLDQAARLSLISLALQHRLFAQARKNAGWDRNRFVQADCLFAEPLRTATRVAGFLNLDITEAEIRARSESLVAIHAKTPETYFAPDLEAKTNSDILKFHEETFEAAMRWASDFELELVCG